MVWAKLDDAILDNPKIIKAGVYGFAMHVAAITWCCRNLTDGRIPAPKVMGLLMLDRVSIDDYNPMALLDGPRSMAGREGLDPIDVAEHLVECGLWEKVEGGYVIHDFLEYNPSKAQVEAERAAKSEAGKTGAAKRWGKATAMAPAMPPAMADPLAKRWQSDAPDPVPDPQKRNTPLASLVPPEGGERSSSVAVAKEKKQRTRSPKTGVPPSDAPPSEVQAWCESWDLPTGHPDLMAMLDWARAGDQKCKDWAARFRNWCRKSDEMAIAATQRGRQRVFNSGSRFDTSEDPNSYEACQRRKRERERDLLGEALRLVPGGAK